MDENPSVVSAYKKGPNYDFVKAILYEVADTACEIGASFCISKEI